MMEQQTSKPKYCIVNDTRVTLTNDFGQSYGCCDEISDDYNYEFVNNAIQITGQFRDYDFNFHSDTTKKKKELYVEPFEIKQIFGFKYKKYRRGWILRKKRINKKFTISPFRLEELR